MVSLIFSNLQHILLVATLLELQGHYSASILCCCFFLAGLQLHPPLSVLKVESGEVFEIRCRQYIAKNPINAAGTFQWISSGSALEGEDDRVSITDGEFLAGYESVLSISDACRGHSGIYTCTYRDGDQVIVESVSFDLKILGKSTN